MKRMYAKWPLVFLIGTVIGLIGGCGGDDGGTGPTITNNKLVLNFYKISPLPAGWYYQVWALKDDVWNVGAAFNLDASLDLIDTQGQSISGNKVTFATLDLTTCDSIRITIQETVGTGPSSAGMTLLQSAIGATASFDLTSPLEGTLQARTINFIFGSPTDSDTTELNELSGIWFTTEQYESAGMDSLPDLPPGYIFESWWLHTDIYLSMGKFTQSSGPDQRQYYYTNAAGAPSFPGEDFLDNSKAPQGLTFPIQPDPDQDQVIISLELEDDPTPELPFIPWYHNMSPLQWARGFPFFMSAVGLSDWPNAKGFIVAD